MPNRDGKGPKGSGLRDGRGEGKGRGTGKGTGSKAPRSSGCQPAILPAGKAQATALKRQSAAHIHRRLDFFHMWKAKPELFAPLNRSG
jgi:hypothetical protein